MEPAAGSPWSGAGPHQSGISARRASTHSDPGAAICVTLGREAALAGEKNAAHSGVAAQTRSFTLARECDERCGGRMVWGVALPVEFNFMPQANCT